MPEQKTLNILLGFLLLAMVWLSLGTLGVVLYFFRKYWSDSLADAVPSTSQ